MTPTEKLIHENVCACGAHVLLYTPHLEAKVLCRGSMTVDGVHHMREKCRPVEEVLRGPKTVDQIRMDILNANRRAS